MRGVRTPAAYSDRSVDHSAIHATLSVKAAPNSNVPNTVLKKNINSVFSQCYALILFFSTMEGRRSWDGVPLGESHLPPQSVPGRRTPLGAVGLGGFYMQGGQPPPPPQHCYPTDENQPEPGTSYAQRLVILLTLTAFSWLYDASMSFYATMGKELRENW